MTKTKFVLSMLGVGLVISLFKIQSVYYKKQIDDLQSQLEDLQVRNKILQSQLTECQQFEDNYKKKADKLVSELLKDFENVKRNLK
ncbi:MAG: hypothetical protein JHC31_00485 [Sulfurihydrogenibium sp.]|nr:hypothetical protein [Sulfurihydrogenibium sp.]